MYRGTGYRIHAKKSLSLVPLRFAAAALWQQCCTGPWPNKDHVLKDDDRSYLEEELPKRNLDTRAEVLRKQLERALSYKGKPAKTKKYSFETSKRIGLVGKKLGMAPQWSVDGKRILCTLIHVGDNHVVDVVDPETWFRKSLTGKRKAYGHYGPRWNVLVGAFDRESALYTKERRSLFDNADVPCKEAVIGMVCTEDAIVKKGARLDVRHFKVGQYVCVSGKTIDFGFQGVMARWGFKGQPRLHTRKSHRRVGCIGSTGDARVWRGKRLPGHMGYEWRHHHGLQIVRINPIKQVIYVAGSVPEVQESGKPVFPTYYPAIKELEEELALEEEGEADKRLITSKDLYAPHLFRFDQPSIVFTEKDETKLANMEGQRAKTAKASKKSK
uniref:Large ribosomal subunit protein uL3m n=1 Tax=Ditylenchus dipsaci TaxID=166011 RepID=A0A915EFA1_9BILA